MGQFSRLTSPNSLYAEGIRKRWTHVIKIEKSAWLNNTYILFKQLVGEHYLRFFRNCFSNCNDYVGLSEIYLELVRWQWAFFSNLVNGRRFLIPFLYLASFILCLYLAFLFLFSHFRPLLSLLWFSCSYFFPTKCLCLGK